MSIKRKKYLAGSRAVTGCHDQGDDTVFRLEMDGMAPQRITRSRRSVGTPLQWDKLQGAWCWPYRTVIATQGQISLCSSEH